MDIKELSHKMEADLLESNTTVSSFETKHPFNSPFTRLTRSQTITMKNDSPVKKEFDEDLSTNRNTIDGVDKMFLNKRPRSAPKNLETIYEYPIWKKGNTVLLGKTKVKRSIYLNNEFRYTSKQKSKQRKMKLKRLGKKIKFKKMTDDEFKSRMSKIESYINGSNAEPNDKDCSIVEFETIDNDKICTDNQESMDQFDQCQ